MSTSDEDTVKTDEEKKEDMVVVKRAVAWAREACACTHCVGGYQIGEFTIGDTSFSRPTSCLAHVILSRM